MRAADREWGWLVKRCPRCKRFVRVSSVTVNGLGDVKSVRGTCRRCGPIEVEWDDYDEVVAVIDNVLGVVP